MLTKTWKILLLNLRLNGINDLRNNLIKENQKLKTEYEGLADLKESLKDREEEGGEKERRISVLEEQLAEVDELTNDFTAKAEKYEDKL